MAAGLPLLRLSTADLIRQDGVSILEWLSQALIDWLDRLESEDDDLWIDVSSRLATSTRGLSWTMMGQSSRKSCLRKRLTSAN
jgi:hypothetical protein